MIDRWIQAHCGTYHRGTLKIQIDIGCDLATRSKKQYIVGADNGIAVRLITQLHHNEPTIAIMRYRDWRDVGNTICYATLTDDSDPSHIVHQSILGTEAINVATTISICGRTKCGVGRLAVCKILASYGTADLPPCIVKTIDAYDQLAKDIQKEVKDNPRKPIPLGKWGQLTISYAPITHGEKTQKPWKLTGPGINAYMSDDDIMTIVTRVRDAAVQLEEDIQCIL